MTPVLWHIELSHFNEKVRWALDYKGLRYERRVPMPGLHGVRALIQTRGAQRRLPVLEIDGRTVGDSTAIIAALEEYAPEPPLYPADPGERARALELEDHFDEALGPELRRFAWHHTIDDVNATSGALFTTPNAARDRLLRATAPVSRRLIRLDYRIDDDTAQSARAAVVRCMDRLESELQPSGYLVGDAFTVADLTAAALFTPVLHPPGRPFMPETMLPAVLELREELQARPGGAWVTRMYAEHRGAYAGEPDVVHH